MFCSSSSDAYHDTTEHVYKSIKVRWGNLLRGVLPQSKLPMSAIWKCNQGLNDSYSIGTYKQQDDGAKKYFACDITSINFDKLTASADVFYPGEDDATEVLDIYLHEFSLVDMTSEEEITEEEDTDMILTDEEIKLANVMLDHLRFFYHVIWFPWDEKQEDEIEDLYETHDQKEDWVAIHLSNRINAYNDYLEGNNDVYDRLKKFAVEHDQLMNRQANIKSFYEDEDEGQDDLIMAENHEIEDSLDMICKKAERLEDLTLRNAFEKITRIRKVEARKSMLSDYARVGHPNCNQVIFLVIGRLTNLKGIMEFMLKAQEKVGFDVKLANVICRENLQSAVDDVLPGDIVILPPGEHILKDWGDLKEGGSVFGISANDPSLIELRTMPRRYGIEISNGATFENIVLSSSHLTNNNDCNEDMSLNDSESIDLSNHLSERHGILVKSGKVHMNNCTILGLECAVKVMTNARIEMKKCKINLNKVGLIAEKNVEIKLDDVCFEEDAECNAEKFGIVIVENMVGNNLIFNNVNLRYGKGHFIFVDSGFFAKKQKKESILHFKNSWDDVNPLLSKAVKTNLVLEGPVLNNMHETSMQSYPLKVVAMLLMDNYDYTKIATNIKTTINNLTKENPNENAEDYNIMSAHKEKGEDLFVTSSGTMVTSTME